MKVTFLPETTQGKWSIIMMISSLFLFILGSILPWKEGYSGFEIIIQNPVQGILTVLMFAVGIATLLLALISIIKKKERSILVFLAIFAGLYSLLGLLGSILTVFFS